MASGYFYSPDEEKLIRDLYPRWGPRGLRQQLPHRSKGALIQKAMNLGVKVGELKTKLTLGEVARYTGMDRAGIRLLALKDGVATRVAGGKKLTVPIEWAEALKQRIDEKRENNKLVGYWYDLAKMSQLFGINHSNIAKAVHGVGHLGHAIPELERKIAGTTSDKWLFNPWQAEELKKRIDRGDPIISKTQGRILREIAKGRQLHRLKKGGSHRHGDYYFEAEGGEPELLSGPAVRRSMTFGLIRYSKRDRVYSLTAAGREALRHWPSKC